MRARTKLALGGGIISIGTALGFAVGGLVGAGTLVTAGPLAGPAHADGLTPFDNCQALLDWYRGRGVKDVGPYGWDLGFAGYDTMRTPGFAPKSAPIPATGGNLNELSDARANVADARGNSSTGTNTQDVDVDEPDVAKTDGRLVVRLVGDRTLVISDVTGTAPRELSRLTLPRMSYGGELLLVGKHVLVLATSDDAGIIRPMPMGGPMRRGPIAQASNVLLDVDISNPAAPRLAHTDRYSGSLISARSYGDEVRLVTSTDRPEFRWSYPRKGVSPAEAQRHNRELVRASTITDWLPSVTTGGRRTPLTTCDHVLHPKAWAGEQTLTVTTFNANAVESRDAVAVTADGQVVYSSADRLYVASNRMDEPPCWRCPERAEAMPIRPLSGMTDLHAFALDGPRTTYVASGSVNGTLRDRWSMDSYDGVLRVAWTRMSSIGRPRNGITTLAERHGSLVPIGSVRALGINENLQSVRWFDGLAVLVTYRQLDPLYTIDLTDPAHPRMLGALKITGYSGYLHPIGHDQLLGLGVEATDRAEVLGGQAAVFDIAHPKRPELISRSGLDGQADLPAVQDPRAFTWLPGERIGLTPVTDPDGARAHLVELKVSPAGVLSVYTIAEGIEGWQARILPLADGRVALVDQQLRILDVS